MSALQKRISGQIVTLIKVKVNISTITDFLLKLYNQLFMQSH